MNFIKPKMGMAGYTLHRFEVSAVDAPATFDTIDSVFSTANSVGIMVEIPAGETVQVTKQSVIRKGGKIGRISTGATPEITLADHGLHAGEQVVISNSNCTPSIDATYNVNSIIDENKFTVVPASAVTSEGTYAECEGPKVYFASTTSVALTASAELHCNHAMGEFIVAVTAKSGAGVMNIWVRDIPS